MRDYDQDIARNIERDGVRMASGQHIDTAPHPRHDTTLLNTPWRSHQCAVTSEHSYCPLLYTDGRICACKCHTRPVEMAFIDREFPEPPDEDPWIDRHDHYDR
jgi:hypothetical protein